MRRTPWRSLLLLTCLLDAPGARAQPSPQASGHCRTAKARAEAARTMLVWPKLTAEALRFPSFTDVVGPTIANSGVQLRFGAALSPTDIVKGVRLSGAAEAECERLDAAEELQQLLLGLGDGAALAGARAQAEFLTAHRDDWAPVLDQAERRRRAGVITLYELQLLRRSVSELERHLASALGEVDRLEHRHPRPPAALDPLVRRYVDRSLGAEREAEALRTLDAFHVGLKGGVIPGIERPSEWFALLEISYSLGGLIGIPDSKRVLQARGEELEHSIDELPALAQDVRGALAAQLLGSRRQLEQLRAEQAANQITLEALASSSGTAADQARATISLDQLLLESQRISLGVLIAELEKVLSAGQPAPASD